MQYNRTRAKIGTIGLCDLSDIWSCFYREEAGCQFEKKGLSAKYNRNFVMPHTIPRHSFFKVE